jgi:hypothetical protein
MTANGIRPTRRALLASGLSAFGAGCLGATAGGERGGEIRGCPVDP